MNVKTISLALAAVVVLLLVTLLMQKGGYVSQATEHYNNTTGNSYKNTAKVVEYLNSSIDVNKTVWALAMDVLQNAKSSQDQARLEAKYFPTTKGTMSLSKKIRKFEASSAYYFETRFAEEVVDKKTQVKSLAGLVSVNVNPLMGVYAADADDGENEEAVEEEAAPEPVKKAPAKKASKKKGKKKRR